MLGDLASFIFFWLYMAVSFGPMAWWLMRVERDIMSERRWRLGQGLRGDPPWQWRVSALRWGVSLLLLAVGWIVSWVLLGGLDRGIALAAWRANLLFRNTWRVLF
jgi:hypothetical protein